MILVTGATGHVGNVLVRELLARDQQVRALILPGERCPSLDGLDVERVEGNVLVPQTLDAAMHDVQFVYHLAGIISIVPGAESLMRRVNVDGVRNVANAALNAGVRRMVHTSSIHAFKRMPCDVIVDEDTPFAPDCAMGTYDQTKAEGSLVVLDAVRRGLDAVIACPTGIIGPYDYMCSELGQTILSYAKRKLHFLIDGAYDFVDVRDVARGLILACERGRTGHAYILSGTQVKLAQLRRLVQELVGVDSRQIVLPYKFALLCSKFAQLFYRLSRTTPRFTSYALRTVRDNSNFSCAKAERELGYTHRQLNETIADIIRWRRELGFSS